MCTGTGRCRLVVFSFLVLLLVGQAWGAYYYKLTLAARSCTPDFAQKTIIFKVHNFVTTDTWITLDDPVVVYGQTWTRVYYGTGLDGSIERLRLAPDSVPGPSPSGVPASIEAHFPTPPGPPNAVGTYDLSGYWDTAVWVSNGSSYTACYGTGSNLVVTDYDPPLVRMSQMSAEGGNRGVTVSWETASELGTAGFVIRRAELDGGPYRLISDLIPSEGSPTIGSSYQWTDSDVQAGREYHYLIEEVEDSGATNSYGPVKAVVPANRRRR